MSLTRLGEALLRADVTDKGVWGALGFVFSRGRSYLETGDRLQ